MRYSSTREADASTAQFGKLSEKGATASQTNPKDPPDDDDACDHASMYMYLMYWTRRVVQQSCARQHATNRVAQRISLTTEAHFR